MSLHGELREVIFGEDQEMRMVWLQQRGLIASQKTCRKCDSDMRLDKEFEDEEKIKKRFLLEPTNI